MGRTVSMHIHHEKAITAPLTISISEEYPDGISFDTISPAASAESHAHCHQRLACNPPKETDLPVMLRGAGETGTDTGASGSVHVSAAGHIIAAMPLDTWLML